MQNSARVQMNVAMTLSRELGLMTQIYNNRLDNLVRSHGVTYPQYVVLDYILRAGSQGTTVSQIADAVEVLQPAVTKIVKKFATMEFLTLKSVPTDKRSKKVIITPQGAGFIGKLQAALMPDVLTCFENWDETRLGAFAAELQEFRGWLETNRL